METFNEGVDKVVGITVALSVIVFQTAVTKQTEVYIKLTTPWLKKG